MYIDLWEKIDHFLYYDYWHREGHEKSREIRENNIEILIKLLEDNFEIYLAKKTIQKFINLSLIHISEPTRQEEI